eukprot:m.98368 g.98368  ORF g.98368 m.98368 type:complete len:77 (+) comp8693_c0_seq3:178-408(+)
MAVPLVYSPGYNIRFFGIEKLHPFDSCKYEKIAAALCEQLPLRPDQLVDPGEPVDEDDLLVSICITLAWSLRGGLC